MSKECQQSGVGLQVLEKFRFNGFNAFNDFNVFP